MSDDFSVDAKIEEWFEQVRINLKSLILTADDRMNVLRLLYQYKHLNFTELIDLFSIDLIIHRVILQFDTKSHSVRQRRYFAHFEWWLRKLVDESVKDDIYERTDKLNEKLSSWNARAVLMNKVKNSKLTDESRLTFDYSWIIEMSSEIHLQLASDCHDYFSNSRHDCYMIVDLKHEYQIVTLHSESRSYFAFIISELNQLQFTKMQQESMTADFIMSELMIRALKSLSVQKESFLFQSDTSNMSSSLNFYMNDIFDEHKNYYTSFNFLKDHFFSRIEWVDLRLFFSKLFLFQIIVKALDVQHTIDEMIQVLFSRLRKIMNFSVSTDLTDVRIFTDTIEIIHRWIFNYSEIVRSLSRLIDKVSWRWDASEQLSFDILKIKSTIEAAMYEHDSDIVSHIYVNASNFAAELVITQFQYAARSNHEKSDKKIEILIVYDSFIFVFTQKMYFIYKKELCLLIKFAVKYDYFCKHSIHTTIIHIDHKSLTHFLKSDCHEDIYEHWADKLRRFNIQIKHILERRNKMIDDLFRIIFKNPDCFSDENVSLMSETLIKEESIWIWKNEKNEYEAFLASLNDMNKQEIVDHDSLHEVDVFAVIVRILKKSSWSDAYRSSNWFADIYRIHTDTKNYRPSFEIFNKAMIYRMNDQSILWIYHRDIYLSCIPEKRVLNLLKTAHDQNKHWNKQDILTKLKESVYWSSQSANVKRYIQRCLQCARHESEMKSQLLHSVRVQKSFQLLSMNFIESLAISTNENNFIFHVIDYFSRFFIITATKTANVSDVTLILNRIFIFYSKPLDIYCDQNQHFNNEEMKGFLRNHEILIDFSSFDASQSTDMIEVSNKLLNEVMKKNEENWKERLNKSIHTINNRIISYFDVSLSNILMSVQSMFAAIDSVLNYVSVFFISIWRDHLCDSFVHFVKIRKYINFRSELHDYVQKRTNHQKNRKAAKFNREINEVQFNYNDLVLLYQKNIRKLETRWRELFKIDEHHSIHEILYKLRQLNERLIKEHFHENHLKLFSFRTDYLKDFENLILSTTQIIRNSRRRKRIAEAVWMLHQNVIWWRHCQCML